MLIWMWRSLSPKWVALEYISLRLQGIHSYQFIFSVKPISNHLLHVHLHHVIDTVGTRRKAEFIFVQTLTEVQENRLKYLLTTADLPSNFEPNRRPFIYLHKIQRHLKLFHFPFILSKRLFSHGYSIKSVQLSFQHQSQLMNSTGRSTGSTLSGEHTTGLPHSN